MRAKTDTSRAHVMLQNALSVAAQQPDEIVDAMLEPYLPWYGYIGPEKAHEQPCLFKVPAKHLAVCSDLKWNEAGMERSAPAKWMSKDSFIMTAKAMLVLPTCPTKETQAAAMWYVTAQLRTTNVLFASIISRTCCWWTVVTWHLAQRAWSS